MRREEGMTVLELLVVLALIAIVIGMVFYGLEALDKARMVRCGEDLWAMETIAEQAWEQTRPWTPTWGQVEQVAGGRWSEHHHYIPNNTDRNKGHGNDLDLCDEENPGNSGSNRDCLQIEWVIVCDHDHTKAGGKYNFSESFGSVYAVPAHRGETLVPFLRNLKWWEGKDPNLQKWIGR